MMHANKTSRRPERGFSLLELMVVLGVLGAILGIAVKITSTLVRTNGNVTNVVDVMQQGRQFMDQISSDIHQGGYPGYKMFDQSAGNAPLSYKYAGTSSTTSGVIAASATALQFEGDVDNSGTVSEVFLRLCVNGTSCTTPTSSSACPCTMQRGTISKQNYQGGAQPSYYTELSGVMNTDVFTYWNYDGSQSDLSNLSNIRAVRVKLQVQSQHKDIANGTYTVATLDSEAKFSN